MKLFVRQLFIVSLMLTLGISHTTFGQSSSDAYYLQLSTNTQTATTIEVVVQIALDPSQSGRKLGSSNFQFLFDTTLLENPTLVQNALSAAYNVVSVTEPTSGKASTNVNLDILGTGDAISTYPTFTNVATLSFDIKAAGGITFEWTDLMNDTRETVVFFDDEDTLRFARSMSSLATQLLSVDWLSFDVYWENEQQQNTFLEWALANNKQVAYYEIERSITGFGNWNTIGKVVGSDAQKYSYSDAFAGTPTAYYRIRAMELDGSSSYSPIQAITKTMPSAPSVNVYPNPAQEALSIELPDAWEGENTTLNITSANGQTFYEYDFGDYTTNIHTLDIQTLPAGVYFLTLSNAEQYSMQKIIKTN